MHLVDAANQLCPAEPRASGELVVVLAERLSFLKLVREEKGAPTATCWMTGNTLHVDGDEDVVG